MCPSESLYAPGCELSAAEISPGVGRFHDRKYSVSTAAAATTNMPHSTRVP